jgi:hypothetical protein
MAYDDDAVVVGALFFRHVHFFVAAAFAGYLVPKLTLHQF